MKTSITITLAALITAVAAFAQDTVAFDPSPVLSGRAAQAVEFVPMTRSERLRAYLTGTFGPNSLAQAAAHAALDQWRDSPHEWDQNGKGFADRFGNAYAKHVIRQTLQYGASSALHEDDRYFASGRSGLFNRAKYAVASAFVARHDNGELTFAAARIGSAAGAAFISRAWQPASASGASNAAQSFGFTLASDIGRNVVREFWPDVKHLFRRN